MSNFVKQPSGTGQQLNHVYGFSPTLALAVGNTGTIVRWDGQKWTQVPSGTIQNLNKVWGASADGIWIAGAGGTLLYSDDQGLTWTQNATINAFVVTAGANYVAIWGSSATDFWIIENVLGEFWHTNTGGLTWINVTSIKSNWQHLWGAGASFIAASGYTGASGAQSTSLVQYDGVGWTGRMLPTGPVVGLGCWPSPTMPQIWSVGYSGPTSATIFDWNRFTPGGTGVCDVVYPDTRRFNGIHGADLSNLLSVGADYRGNGMIAQLGSSGSPTSPAQWSNLYVPPTLPQGRGGFLAVYADASGYAAAVGYAGAIAARPSSTMSLVSAVPVSTKTLRVTLSAIPLAQSQIGAGDALNTQSWFIERLDTNQRFTTIGVSAVSETVYDITIAERFGSSLVQHEVSASTLVDAFMVSIVDPVVLDFYGVVYDQAADQDAKAAANRYVVTDIANPPFPDPTSNLGGGVRVITAAGDFAAESGNTLLQKLIMRRLTTTPGGFFHLPNYGLGLNVKQPVRQADMVGLKKRIEDQVSLEPEVVAVNVRITLDSLGILTVTGVAKTTTGEVVPFSSRQSTNPVTL